MILFGGGGGRVGLYKVNQRIVLVNVINQHYLGFSSSCGPLSHTGVVLIDNINQAQNWIEDCF